MKKLVRVTSDVEVELDESKFTPEFMEEFRRQFYPFDTLDQHVTHLAQLFVRGIVGGWKSDEFIEGYGPRSAMGSDSMLSNRTRKFYENRTRVRTSLRVRRTATVVRVRAQPESRHRDVVDVAVPWNRYVPGGARGYLDGGKMTQKLRLAIRHSILSDLCLEILSVRCLVSGDSRYDLNLQLILLAWEQREIERELGW